MRRVLPLLLGYFSLAVGVLFAIAASVDYRWTCSISAVAVVGALISLGMALKPAGPVKKAVLVLTMSVATLLLASDIGVVVTSRR